MRARRPPASTALMCWLPDETLQAVRDYVVSIKGRSPRPWAAASAR